MKLLITGAYNCNQKQIEQIGSLGFETDFLQYEKDEVDCEKYDGVICNGLFLYHDIKKFKNLKFIQLTSAGYDRVPMEYVKEKRIKIFNAEGVYSIPIAEHTVLKILEFYKKSREFYKKQESCKWEKERDILELCGKKAAIIGCGNIGKEIAKRLYGFGVEIVGVDIRDIKCDFVSRYEHINNLNNVLSESDIVVLTLPLNENTKGIINKECFKAMKRSGFLVNVSRGKIIVQSDLIEALNSGEIAGAALDVFEEEPLDEGSGLWNMENVIITPHNSFVGEGNIKRLDEIVIKNLERIKL